MRPGERFSFRALVSDVDGCPLDARPTWSLGAGSSAITLSGNGTVVVRDDAQDGTADIAVSLAGRSVHLSVEVATPARYDALLSARSHGGEGPVEEAVVAVVTGNVAANTAVAQDTARSRKTPFVVIVGGLALGLAVLGVMMPSWGNPRIRRAKGARFPLRARPPSVDNDCGPVHLIFPNAPRGGVPLVSQRVSGRKYDFARSTATGSRLRRTAPPAPEQVLTAGSVLPVVVATIPGPRPVPSTATTSFRLRPTGRCGGPPSSPWRGEIAPAVVHDTPGIPRSAGKMAPRW